MEREQVFGLGGKRVLVTGAASGMGRSLTQLACGSGASVALLDIDAEGLKETASTVGETNVSIVPVDLTKWQDVEAAVGRATTELGGLDVVASVAGWDAPGVFWEQPLELWQQLVDINLWATLHLMRAVTPIFTEQGSGRIVTVASDAGRVGSKGESVYAATKGAIIALTKSLARELAPFGVGVNCVCPGPTRTPLFEQEAKDNPKLMDKLSRAVPLKRIGEPEDQAAAVAFLASDAASYITGQVLSVSGGLTMV